MQPEAEKNFEMAICNVSRQSISKWEADILLKDNLIIDFPTMLIYNITRM